MTAFSFILGLHLLFTPIWIYALFSEEREKAFDSDEPKGHLVQVIGIPQGMAESRLRHFFANPKRGGAIESLTLDKTTGTALVEFTKYSGNLIASHFMGT